MYEGPRGREGGVGAEDRTIGSESRGLPQTALDRVLNRQSRHRHAPGRSSYVLEQEVDDGSAPGEEKKAAPDKLCGVGPKTSPGERTTPEKKG